MADEQRIDLLGAGVPDTNTRLIGYQVGGSVALQYPVDTLLGGGAAWHDGAGAPSGALGSVGDYYLNTTNGDVYAKTGESSWTLTGNIKGETGDTGPAGPAGADGPQGPAGDTGPAGADGADGVDGTKFYTGVGPPDNGLGVIGDLYLDNELGDLFEKIGVAEWSNGPSLMGPAGPAGPQGPAGADGADGSKWYDGAGAPAGGLGVVGDFYLDTANGDFYEKTGASTWTLDGNLAGPAGADGAAGAAGADGADGSKWYDGAGVPAGGLGVVGDFYLDTANGDFYEKTGASAWTLDGNLTGPAGADGADGADGAAGADGEDGVATLSLQPQSYQPPSTNYATFETRNQIGVLAFDPATQEAARWVFLLPTGRTYTGGLTVKVHWCTTATSGDGRWGCRVARLTGVDIDSDTYDTAVEATTTTSGTAGLVNTTTLSAVGVDSAVAGDVVQLELYRDVGDSADTINSNDLQVVSVQIELP